MEADTKRDVTNFVCYPTEAFTDEALFWRRVLDNRHDFDFETNKIARPLTDAQMKAANAWKIAYLQRLRREKTDESYINAYLKAWNLSPAEVFPETNSQ
jgi:hypothetical protein